MEISDNAIQENFFPDTGLRNTLVLHFPITLEIHLLSVQHVQRVFFFLLKNEGKI